MVEVNETLLTEENCTLINTTRSVKGGCPQWS